MWALPRNQDAMPKVDANPAHMMMPTETAVSSEAKPADGPKAILFKTAVCPNCKVAGAILEEAGVNYEAMDANDAPERVKKYGIMQAPTLVMIDGDSYEKFSGVSDIRGWLNKKHS